MAVGIKRNKYNTEEKHASVRMAVGIKYKSMCEVGASNALQPLMMNLFKNTERERE